jgi:glycosyltransferase involved in cell wall biosynthesis
MSTAPGFAQAAAATTRRRAMFPPFSPHGAPARDVADLSDVRLALFSDTWAPQLNGVTRTLARLVAAVRERGGAAQVVTAVDPRGAPPIDACGEACGDDVVRWPSVAFWGYPELRLAAPQLRPATRLLRAYRPTLVHLATPFGVGLAGRLAARRLAVPLVSSYHTSFSAYAGFYGLGALADPGWRFLRWFHAGGRRTYAPTAAVADELRAHGFGDVAVWGRGVDAERFSPLLRRGALRASWGVRTQDVVALYVGRLAREKGVALALDAMRLAGEALERAADGDAAAPRLRAVVVGEGPYDAECRARAPEGTVFTGRLEGRALGEAYASADLFVFPSQTDTFGNVLLEAMAAGVAVVAVDAPPRPTRARSPGGWRGWRRRPGCAASSRRWATRTRRRARGGACGTSSSPTGGACCPERAARRSGGSARRIVAPVARRLARAGGRLVAHVLPRVEARHPPPVAPGVVGPERRVAPGGVQVPAPAAAGDPHGALHPPVDVGQPSGLCLGARLERRGPGAREVVERAQQVVDLRLEHQHDRRVPEPRVGA